MTTKPEKTLAPGDTGSSSPPSPVVASETVVVKLKKKKKKRKYSGSLREVQVLGRGVSKSLRRVAKATERGLDRWTKASNKSSRKRRDGALRDAAENTAKAVSRSLRELSRAPLDAVPALRKLRVRKSLSRLIPF